MRPKFMDKSSVPFLEINEHKLEEKLPFNLKIAKLSVSYSNHFFDLVFNFDLVQKQPKNWKVLFFL